jgi:ADP-ribosylglycohydrolase
MDLLDKFKGCILGAAVGDALGMSVERLTREQIKETYGRVMDYMKADPRTYKDLHTLKPGQYTDDTALTAVIAESLIAQNGVDIDDIARKHVERYLQDPRLGWGRATKAAFEQLLKGASPRESGQPSCGNGTAMKIAPLGLWYAPRPPTWELQVTAFEIANITHNDTHARAAAAFQACMVRDLAVFDSCDRERFLAVAKGRTYLGETEPPELARRLRLAYQLISADAQPDEAIARLGTSGNVLESLPAAVYFAGRAPQDFETAVTEGVNAGRDTDTVASMAGALCGAANGVQAIPKRLINGLDNRAYLEDLATRLYTAATKP